jgi:hypothetical protein
VVVTSSTPAKYRRRSALPSRGRLSRSRETPARRIRRLEPLARHGHTGRGDAEHGCRDQPRGVAGASNPVVSSIPQIAPAAFARIRRDSGLSPQCPRRNTSW